MDKRGQGNLGLFVMLFIGVIVAIALFVQIIDTTSELTTKVDIVNESDDLSTCVTAGAGGSWQINESNSLCNITLTNAPTGWKQTDCPLESVTVVNSSGGADYTEGTDYNLFASTGIIQMLNTTTTENITANTTFTSYTYCKDGYNKDASARSIANIVPLFAALGIVAFVFIGIRREWFI